MNKAISAARFTCETQRSADPIARPRVQKSLAGKVPISCIVACAWYRIYCRRKVLRAYCERIATLGISRTKRSEH